MKHPSPTPSSGTRLPRLATTLGILTALLAGGLTTLTAPPAEALPGECAAKIIGWTTKGSTTWYDDQGEQHTTERGVKPIFSGSESTCDVIAGPSGPPDHPSVPDTSGSDPAPTPAPPGPVLPAPPPSMPLAAGPKCVPGANNSSDPESSTDGGTGSGEIVIENVTEGQRSGDLELAHTTPSRIVSMNVNLGAPESGVPGSNPFEGDTPAEAAQRLLWDGMDVPFVETSNPARAVLKAVADMAIHAGQGNKGARVSFQKSFSVLSLENRTIVINEILDFVARTEARYAASYKSLPPGVKSILEDIMHEIDLVLDMPIVGPITDLAPLYAEAASAGSAAGAPSGTACGQVGSIEVAAMAGIAPGSDWVTITMTGTTHGTLVDELKTMAAAPPSVSCPSIEIDAVAGEPTTHNVTDGCRGTVTAVRLMTHAEIDALPESEKRGLLPMTDDSMSSDVIAQGTLDDFADPGSRSWLADGSTGFGSGRLGDLYYKAPLPTGGFSDALVAAATGADGVEYPFLIKVGVKIPPTCKTDGPIHGVDPDGTHGSLNGGTLELERGQFFLIDPKLLCTTDGRDSYRVDIAGTIPGTTRDVDPDGNYLFTWDDTDTVGQIGTLVVTAWDEVTGAPSAPVTLKVVVRDRAPDCKDVSLTYDGAALKGAPMTVPLACAMPDGLALLQTPVARFAGTSSADGTLVVQPEGTFQVTGSTVTFTPQPGAIGTVSATDVRAWSSAPGGDLRPRESAPFAIHVEITE